MQFLINQASECNVDMGDYNSIYKNNDDLLHISCFSNNLNSQQAMYSNLIKEFGTRSRNYAWTFQFSSPKSFRLCNGGSGLYRISSYIIPYLIDQYGRFTTDENSRVGGLFVKRADIDIVKNYIENIYPSSSIIDTVEPKTPRIY